MLKRILFPTKFEEFSLAILKSIIPLKEAGMEEIILLHVIDPDGLYTEKETGLPFNPDLIRKAAMEQFTSYAEYLHSEGIRVKTKIIMGGLVSEILKTAEEMDVSLIIAGRQKRYIPGELFTGSTTNRVIRKAKVPVLVAKCHILKEVEGGVQEHFCVDMFRKILYPTDWSSHAERAKEYISVLRILGASEVIILHVIEELLPEIPLYVYEDLEASLRKSSEEKIEALRYEFQIEGFKVKTVVAKGKAYKVINRIATEEDASLIVMGSHGKGFKSLVGGVLWGSVSQWVVEYSEKPVLVVR